MSTGDIYHTPSSMLLIRDEFVLVGCGKDVFLFNLFGDLVNQFSIPDAGVGAMDVSPDFSHLVVGCRTNIRMWYIGDFIPTQNEKQVRIYLLLFFSSLFFLFFYFITDKKASSICLFCSVSPPQAKFFFLKLVYYGC